MFTSLSHRRAWRRTMAAVTAPLILLASACSNGGSDDTDATASPTPTQSYDTTVSWLSQTDWDAHPSTGADLVFFGQIEAPVKATDLMAHAKEAAILVFDGDSTDPETADVKTITSPSEALSSQAAKPQDETGDTLTMDDALGGVTLDLHYELSNNSTPISDVFSQGLFDIAYTPDEDADLSTILGLGTSTANATQASSDEASAEATSGVQGNADLDAAVSYYGAPTSIWYWDDTSTFNPLSPESGGSYELCWIYDDYAFTITVGEVPGYEDSIISTAFSYYSGAAWDVFEQQLKAGTISGMADDANSSVVYMPFEEFKDEYISGKAAAEASASAAASASAEAAASASASGAAVESADTTATPAGTESATSESAEPSATSESATSES